MWLRQQRVHVLVVVLSGAVVTKLMLWQLSALTSNKLSDAEQIIATAPIGWHGILMNPFHVVVKLCQSIGFLLGGQGGALVTRLPSVIFGIIAIIALGLVLRAWHGLRTAILGTLLFACSAWVLHVSRHAGYDSEYLAAIPVLFITHVALQKMKLVLSLPVVLIIWGLLLYVPGMIWLILFAAWWQRDDCIDFWKLYKKWWQRGLLLGAAFAWIPLLAVSLIRHTVTLTEWIGLPSRLDGLGTMAHRLLSIPKQLFLRGPSTPDLWLGRLPLLDVFVSVMVVFGLVYYVRHRKSSRTILLGTYLVLGSFLIALGGDVPLSFIVPVFYLLAGSGMALLLRDWFNTFPVNPVMRSIGVACLTVAVLASCYYNLQSYFVAWPHAKATIAAYTNSP